MQTWLSASQMVKRARIVNFHVNELAIDIQSAVQLILGRQASLTTAWPPVCIKLQFILP